MSTHRAYPGVDLVRAFAAHVACSVRKCRSQQNFR